MAYVSYSQRGKKKLWAYTIRQGNKSLEYQSGFKTKKEAKLIAEKILHKINTGSVIRQNMSLPELYQEWLDLKILPSNKSQQTKDKYIMRKNIIKRLFGSKPISKIKASEYQKIMNDYGQTVSRNHLGRLNSNIRSCIKMAIADKIFIEDFTYSVELFSNKKGQDSSDKYLHTVEDYKIVMDYLVQKWDYSKSIVPYIIFFLFKTGLRYGELVALTWDDIDFNKEIISTYRRYNTSIHQFTPPKNKPSVRKIPITRELVKVFKQLKKSQAKVNKELGLINPYNLVFQHFGYQHDIPDIATVNKAMKTMLLELDIRPLITTKGARHTFGSYLWHNDIDLGVIAKILGHKDIAMLVEVYGHTLEEKINEEFITIKKLI
jgi:integrase/recombinase, phage associated protein